MSHVLDDLSECYLHHEARVLTAQARPFGEGTARPLRSGTERAESGAVSDTAEQHQVAPSAHCRADQKWSCHQRLIRFSVGEVPFRFARHYRGEGMRSYPRPSAA